MAEDGLGIYSGAMPDKDPYKGVNDVVSMDNKLLGNQQLQTQVESSKLDLAAKQLGQMNSMLSDLLADPEAGRADMTKKISERAQYGAKSGLFTPAQVVEGLKGLPSDPKQQYQWLLTHHSAISSATEKLNNFVGQQVTEGVGGGSVTTQTPAYPGLPVRTRKMQQYGLPPGTEETITEGPNRGAKMPIGSPVMQPPQQGPDSVVPAAPVARPLAPGQRMPPPGATPQAGAPTQPATPRIVTARPPTAGAADAAATDAYSGAMAAAGKYGQRVNPLRQAIPILEGMKETDIGPTSERWNDIKSTAQTLGAGKLAGIDPEKIKDYNELKKYFNQYSAQVGATLGPKTNEGLATAVTSNPNVNMDKLSATDLAKVALGIERMQQAGALEFQAGVDANVLQPGDFNKFMLKWGTQQDPRAFVYDILDDKAQEKVRKLPPAERAKVAEGMKIAKKHGLLGDVHRGE